MARPKRRPVDPPTHTRVVRSLRTFGNELELYVGAASRESAMHRTDLSALTVVMDAGDDPVTPGRLSSALQLSAPATSAVLDRLERLGHVRRSRHPSDRRSVVVEITDHALDVGGAMFGLLGRHFAGVLAQYDDDELELVASFLDRAAEATASARADLRG